MNLTNPFIELGKQRGLQQGREEGEADLVLKLLGRLLTSPDGCEIINPPEIKTPRIARIFTNIDLFSGIRVSVVLK